MINNYKAQRNVRAELGGAVDLGEPVSLYISEDEVKYGSDNLVVNGDCEVTDPTTVAIGGVAGAVGDATFDDSTTVAHSGSKSLKVTGDSSSTYPKITWADGSDMGLGSGSIYYIECWGYIPAANSLVDTLQLKVTANNGSTTLLSSSSQPTDDTWTKYSGTFVDDDIAYIQFIGADESGSGSGAQDFSSEIFYMDDLKIYKVIDYTYKLMAVNDNIPATSISTYAGEGVGAELSDLLSTDQETAMADSLAADNNSFDFSTSNSTIIGTNMFTGTTAAFNNFLTRGKLVNSSGQAKVTLPLTTVVGRRYDVEFDVIGVSGVTVTVSLSADTDVDTGSQATGIGVSTDNNLNAPFTATATTSYLVIQNSDADGTDFVTLDDLKVYEVFGYDYYNAPAYKFGIVSSVYDQDTGAMKSTGAAGDQVEVTVQGECILRKSGTYSLAADRIIGRISNASALTHATPADDTYLPNSVAVTSEATSSSNTQPIILWQGVEFSESFVHKNSLQVKAKCAETITKFRPVSLYLDSAGDLLCRHDDIPEQAPSPDTDHTGVDPGKWGIAELGGASGEIIPITVAGKTTIATDSSVPERTAGLIVKRITEGGWLATQASNNDYLPNALGTVMETGTGGDDIPITIFNGTPIGTITDWKRTIKVTAKANGAVTQYCPVSLYLDQYGEYKCISDSIPNANASSTNAIWCDFRKWGVAQTTVADGEFVEVIVQGRTNVVDTLDSANRGEFVLRITSAGVGVSGSSTIYALSTLGVVEKEAKTSDGTPGTIIIF